MPTVRTRRVFYLAAAAIIFIGIILRTALQPAGTGLVNIERRNTVAGQTDVIRYRCPADVRIEGNEHRSLGPTVTRTGFDGPETIMLAEGSNSDPDWLRRLRRLLGMGAAPAPYVGILVSANGDFGGPSLEEYKRLEGEYKMERLMVTRKSRRTGTDYRLVYTVRWTAQPNDTHESSRYKSVRDRLVTGFVVE